MRNALSQTRLKQLLHYAPETGVFTWRVTRCGRALAGNEPGKIDPDGYRRIYVDGVLYKASRLAWLYVHGHWPPEHIDHINRNPSDNRISNLRLATVSQNAANKPVFRNNVLRVKGVRQQHPDGPYEARIQVNKRPIFLGRFDTLSAAKAAYDEAAKLHFGEFARSA